MYIYIYIYIYIQADDKYIVTEGESDSIKLLSLRYEDLYL